MKKLILSAVMSLALISSVSLMAQDNKPADKSCCKAKTECPKDKNKDACCDEKKSADCKKKDKKSTCCADNNKDKKTKSAK